MTRRLAKMKTMLAAVVMFTAMMLGMIPVAFAQEAAEEISVTGVVSYQGTKADGTPIYGITDDSTLGDHEEGYLLEGDYSAYVGKRITVHGTHESGHVERVLDVSWVEEEQQSRSTEEFEVEDGESSLAVP